MIMCSVIFDKIKIREKIHGQVKKNGIFQWYSLEMQNFNLRPIYMVVGPSKNS